MLAARSLQKPAELSEEVSFSLCSFKAHSHPSCSLLGSAVAGGESGTCVCRLVLPVPECSLWERASSSDVFPFQQVPLSYDL